jgi:hypothetical protein
VTTGGYSSSAVQPSAHEPLSAGGSRSGPRRGWR